MKWTIDTLRHNLPGRHFYLETDHRALQWLHRMKDANNVIAVSDGIWHCSHIALQSTTDQGRQTQWLTVCLRFMKFEVLYSLRRGGEEM